MMSASSRPKSFRRSQSSVCTKRPPQKSILKHANTFGNDGSRTVNFSTIDIREYPIIPSDNPGGEQGPPVTIDWEYQSTLSTKVDEYEQARPKRRTATQIIMPATVRHRLLIKSGYTSQEIQKCTRKANIARRQRRTTAEMQHRSSLSETTEKLTRGLSNLTLKRGKKQKEREFLKKAAVKLESKNIEGSKVESMELGTEAMSIDDHEEVDKLVFGVFEA